MPDTIGVFLPEDSRKLLDRSLTLIEACKVSQAIRAAYARALYAVIETGRQDGTRSRANMLYSHCDRLASHLFTAGFRFSIDYEYEYPKDILERARIASRVLTRDWERTNTDTMFAQGVFEALRYGCVFLKQWVQQEGDDKSPVFYSSLVMPWNFGVTNERNNSLDHQDAMCETITLTLPEVWRRISHLPDAEKLFHRIKSNASKGQSGGEADSFMHPVFSTQVLQTGVQNMLRPVPGGIVQLNNDPNYAIMGPEIGVDLVKMYELWVRNGDDYATVQIIEPDIMVTPTPYTKISNALISGQTHSGLHPYTRICANDLTGYMWGRSEVVDLIEPQGMVSTWCDDATRLFGLQIDKILGFAGFDGLNDENYDQFRAAGYFKMDQGATVQDLTPRFPPETLGMIQFAMQLVNKLGGFDNIMDGQGQPGVRSAEQGELLKTMASPRLYDRSLLLERQCAAAGDLRLSLREAKDGHSYWTDPNAIENTKFVLADLPEDRRVSVDSHSSSPIFKQQHQQLVAFGLKSGIVNGESAIELLSDLPMRDILIQRWKEAEEQHAQLIKMLMEKDLPGAVQLLSGKKR